MLAFFAGAVVFVALTLYALLGGADFGGGVLDLFATGPRAARQRELITHAIGPIWEANHVWMIVVLVVIWTCFPAAYARIGTGLHIPITLLLVGIVCRGVGFVFRSYDTQRDEVHQRWSLLFAAGSVLSPLMLGTSVGAIASGRLLTDPATGGPRDGFITPWFSPFPLTIGAFTLALFTWLAAVYLTVEADDHTQEDFRRRGLVAGTLAGALAFLGLALGLREAPTVIGSLLGSWWSIPFHVTTLLVAFGALAALATRRYRVARVLTAGQVVAVVAGWGTAQYPWILVDELTFDAAAAPDAVIRVVLAVIVAGGVSLTPAFVWMYRVFKGGTVLQG